MKTITKEIQIITIGKDTNGKELIKVKIPDLEKQYKLFSHSDVMLGNPLSNIAVGFIYTWKSDKPPQEIQDLFVQCSNYAAITGYWRTTNGGKYVIANILNNPNINKFIVCIFDHEDNGHHLANAVLNFWKNGIDETGKIIDSCASNPRFEGINKEATNRVRKQADCIILPHATSEKIMKILNGCVQEPENAVLLDSLNISPVHSVPSPLHMYDDGARFKEPYTVEFSHIVVSPTERVGTEKKHGNSITAKNLEDAFNTAVHDVFCHGTQLEDQRNIIIKEERSLSIVIQNPLEKIPNHYSGEFLKKYTDEFLYGGHHGEFAYTYHERIFKRWGNQVERLITLLKQNPNTRRGLIALWDPECDLESQTPPCLDFIWFCIRENKLECHVMFRSHHLATTTSVGEIIPGEGAFVPNIYAIAHLQKMIAEKISIQTGVIIVTDFSAHIYIAQQ